MTNRRHHKLRNSACPGSTIKGLARLSNLIQHIAGLRKACAQMLIQRHIQKTIHNITYVLTCMNQHSHPPHQSHTAHRTGRGPRHSRVSCDPETALPAWPGSGRTPSHASHPPANQQSVGRLIGGYDLVGNQLGWLVGGWLQTLKSMVASSGSWWALEHGTISQIKHKTLWRDFPTGHSLKRVQKIPSSDGQGD